MTQLLPVTGTQEHGVGIETKKVQLSLTPISN